MHTGTSQFVRPSLGSWALYGLGTLNENLPGFITINPPAQNAVPRTTAAPFFPPSTRARRSAQPVFPVPEQAQDAATRAGRRP
nr:DUF1501 domain-containing protein [Verrucomicrobium spinosum]